MWQIAGPGWCLQRCSAPVVEGPRALLAGARNTRSPISIECCTSGQADASRPLTVPPKETTLISEVGRVSIPNDSTFLVAPVRNRPKLCVPAVQHALAFPDLGGWSEQRDAADGISAVRFDGESRRPGEENESGRRGTPR